MAKFKFKLDKKGVRQLLQSKEMQSLISQKASDIQSRCGDGYVSHVAISKTRVHALVVAETVQAKRDNVKNNTLLKAVRG